MSFPTDDEDGRFTNWSGTYGCQPRQFDQPATEEELVALVEQTAREGGSLRVVGAGHSFNASAICDDHLVNLDALDALIAIDPACHRVTVQAGIRLTALNDLLDRHGLAMINLGSISEQSIAGAVSTGTHGTGLRLGCLSTLVVGMRLVTAGGEVLDLDAERDPERMAAARLSLGQLGVVTRLTLQCMPAYRLCSVAYPLPFDEALAQLDALIHNHRHVRLYWFANTDVIQVMCYDPTDAPASPPSAIESWWKDVVLRQDLMQLFMENGYSIPGLVAPINRFSAKVGFVREERVDRSDRILTIPTPPVHDECEYGVPVERAAEAIRGTRHLIERADYKANVPVEFRFVAADDIWLSPACDRAICYIGAYTFGDQFSAPYFAGFQGYMKSLGARGHWGKVLDLGAEEARAQYPMFDRFNALRRELDPKGVFQNAYTREKFGA